MKIFRKFKRLKRWKCSLNKFYKFRIIKSNSARRRYQLSKANVSWIRKKSYISVLNSASFPSQTRTIFSFPSPYDSPTCVRHCVKSPSCITSRHRSVATHAPRSKTLAKNRKRWKRTVGRRFFVFDLENVPSRGKNIFPPFFPAHVPPLRFYICSFNRFLARSIDRSIYRKFGKEFKQKGRWMWRRL